MRIHRLSWALLLAALALAATAAASGSTAAPWSGTWSSSFGELKLVQSGSTVTGTYTHDQGRVSGTVHGNVLSGRWDEAPTRKGPNDAGPFEFTLAADGTSFTGRWGYDGNPGVWAGDWIGRCASGACAQTGLGRLNFRIYSPRVTPSLSMPTTMRFDPQKNYWMQLVAWFEPMTMRLPGNTYFAFQLRVGRQWKEFTYTSPNNPGYAFHAAYACLDGKPWNLTWRAVLRTTDRILVVSPNTVRTICTG